MKTVLAVLIITCFTLALYAQNSPKEVQEMVFDAELIKNWKGGQNSKWPPVTKVKDGNDGWHRTNVLYRSPNDVLDEVELRYDILVTLDDAPQSWVLQSGVSLGMEKDRLSVSPGGNWPCSLIDHLRKQPIWKIFP